MPTILLSLVLATAVLAEEAPLAPYAEVEVTQTDGLTPAGAPIITVKRVWVKAPTVVMLGGRAFVRGEGIDRVTIEGSDWQVLLLPLDQVRAIAGVDSVQAVTRKLGTRGELIGVVAK